MPRININELILSCSRYAKHNIIPRDEGKTFLIFIFITAEKRDVTNVRTARVRNASPPHFSATWNTLSDPTGWKFQSDGRVIMACTENSLYKVDFLREAGINLLFNYLAIERTASRVDHRNVVTRRFDCPSSARISLPSFRRFRLAERDCFLRSWWLANVIVMVINVISNL